MMIFGVCFVLYLIKLSAGKGEWNRIAAFCKGREGARCGGGQGRERAGCGFT